MRKSRQIFAPHSLSRRRQRRKQIALGVGVGLCALVLGSTVVVNKYNHPLGQLTIWLPFLENNSIAPEDRGNSSKVLQLAPLSAKERAAELEAIAQGKKSLERSRARYLLAADLIEQKQGKKALGWLEGLEWDYPVLAGYVILKRAQAYEQVGEQAKALAAWQDLVQHHAKEPVAARGLYALLSDDSKYQKTDIAVSPTHSGLLGKVQLFYAPSPDDPKYWEKAIANYPSHPLILELAQQRLKEDAAQPDLMLLMAKYAFDSPDVTLTLDKLVGNYSQVTGKGDKPLIQPKNWEAIALAYWLDRKYGQASDAYANAEYTSRNAYLKALGLQYAQKTEEAKRAYKKMVQDFPKAKESFDALVALAKLEPDIEAVPHLDQAIKQFPDRAGEALLAKAETLDRLKSDKAAAETRRLLLTNYGELAITGITCGCMTLKLPNKLPSILALSLLP
ncbi:hypothetical protein IQ258_23735 [Coleofasciculus sp. LEGE 07081]|uniref:tol-pal system YbgF family protein n=1 Tax=Coleofasciculus sp. LEGE 07081 TaxID=2777967 RepID=UPI001880FBC2|nr:hypothetical protein [Coleofasciculus sp. LEGE 07081]MBE9129079.1 hypothetical protein [Coleofasciculus sp. LEGE 07081]